MPKFSWHKKKRLGEVDESKSHNYISLSSNQTHKQSNRAILTINKITFLQTLTPVCAHLGSIFPAHSCAQMCKLESFSPPGAPTVTLWRWPGWPRWSVCCWAARSSPPTWCSDSASRSESCRATTNAFPISWLAPAKVMRWARLIHHGGGSQEERRKEVARMRMWGKEARVVFSGSFKPIMDFLGWFACLPARTPTGSGLICLISEVFYLFFHL